MKIISRDSKKINENLVRDRKLCYRMCCQLTHYRNGVQGMYDDDSLAMVIATLLGKITALVIKYIGLAWAIAWGIHLSATL